MAGYTGYTVQQDTQRRRDVADLLLQQALNSDAGNHGGTLGAIGQALSGVGAVYGGYRAGKAENQYGDIERQAEILRSQQGPQAADQYMQGASVGPNAGQSILNALRGAGQSAGNFSGGSGGNAPTVSTRNAPTDFPVAPPMGAQQPPSGPAPVVSPPRPSAPPPSAATGGAPAWLIQSESGGNDAADNGLGYVGAGQFGQERLADAVRAGVITPEQANPAAFKNDPAAQRAVEQWHFADIDKNSAPLIGAEVNGMPITQEAARGIAHLGGMDGLRRYVESGGAYDPADKFGTHLSDYHAKALGLGGMGGGGWLPGAGGGAGGMRAAGSDLPKNMDPIEALYLGRLSTMADPARAAGYAAQIRDGTMSPIDRAKWAAERDDETWKRQQDVIGNQRQSMMDRYTQMRNARQDASGVGGDEYGLNLVYARGEDGQLHAYQPTKAGGMKEVTLPGGQAFAPGVSTINAGNSMQIIDNKGGGVVGSVPIDNAGKAAQSELGAARGKAAAGLGDQEINVQRALDSIDSIVADPNLPAVTGQFDGMTPGWSPSWSQGSQDLLQRIDGLQAQGFTNAIGALVGMGAMSNMEGEAATRSLVNLSRRQSPEQFKKALKDLGDLLKAKLEVARQKAALAGGTPGAAPAAPGGADDPDAALFDKYGVQR